MTPPRSSPAICAEHAKLAAAVSRVEAAQTTHSEILRRVEGHLNTIHGAVDKLDGRLVEATETNGRRAERLAALEGRLNPTPETRQLANLAGRFDGSRDGGRRIGFWIVAVVGWGLALAALLLKVL